jgi:hypothetical protein
MEKTFKSHGKLIYDIDGHKGYLIEWKFVSEFCKKWSKNREPDQERINEMVAFFKNGGYIPRMIHLAETVEEGMICYDGNHRKEVFNICYQQNCTCIVDVMFSATQYDVFKNFTNINKAVQLPAMYIDESPFENTKTNDILKLVKQYEQKYKMFLSTSPRCHAPQFNRDNFTDNLYSIYKAFGESLSIEQIGKLLEKLNDEYSRGNICKPHSSYKTSIVEKCKKHNFWLFIDKTIQFEHLERVLNQTTD